MGRLRSAAVASMACTGGALRFTRTSVKQHLYAPKGSGYVEKDEDSTFFKQFVFLPYKRTTFFRI